MFVPVQALTLIRRELTLPVQDSWMRVMINVAMVHGADPSGKGGHGLSARHGLIVMWSMAFLYFGGGGMKVRRSRGPEERRRRTTGNDVDREIIGRRG